MVQYYVSIAWMNLYILFFTENFNKIIRKFFIHAFWLTCLKVINQIKNSLMISVKIGLLKKQ